MAIPLLQEIRRKIDGLSKDLDGLKAFVDQLENVVGPLERLMQGGSAQRLAWDHPYSSTQGDELQDMEPPTMKAALLRILKSRVGHPMPNREIIDIYKQNGWRFKSEDQLKATIRSTLSVMAQVGEIQKMAHGMYRYTGGLVK